MKTRIFSLVIAIISVLLVCSFIVKTPIEEVKVSKENRTQAFNVSKKTFDLKSKLYHPLLEFREYMKDLYIQNNPSFSIQEQHLTVKHWQGRAESFWQEIRK